MADTYDTYCCDDNFPAKVATPDAFNVLNISQILDLNNPETNLNRTEVINAASSLNRVINGFRSVQTGYNYTQFTSQFPDLASRADRGQLFSAEIALFANDFQIKPTNISSEFDDYLLGRSIITNDMSAYFGNLNTFYGSNVGASLSGGFCAAFTNIFEKISLLITLVKTVEGFINDLKNANPEDILLGILQAVFGPIISVITSIIKAIEALAQQFLATVEAIEEGLKGLVEDIQEGAEAVSQSIKNRVQEVKNFFSEENMTSLKQYIEKMITAAASAFESLDPWIIGMLMYRFCQLTNAIQDFMESPVKGLQTFAKGMVKSQLLMANIEATRGKSAVEAGAVRFTAEETRLQKRNTAETFNSSSNSPQAMIDNARQNERTALDILDRKTKGNFASLNSEAERRSNSGIAPLDNFKQSLTQYGKELFNSIGKKYDITQRNWFDTIEIKPYVTLKDFTTKEVQLLGGLRQRVPIILGKVIFLPPIYSVTQRKDGFDTGNNGPGWQEVTDSVWIKLIRTSDQLGYPLTVSNGFLPGHDLLSTGNAVAVQVVTEQQQLELIIAASRAGFKGIHVQGIETILVDTNGRQGPDAGSRYVKDALQKHRKNEWVLAQEGKPIINSKSQEVNSFNGP